LLQQVRGLLQQANIHGAVANQVAMTARAPEGLKEYILIARRRFRRRSGPKIFQRDSCALKFASGQVDGKKWQHQVEAVGVAP
jgi:hypothetical protein